MSWYTLFRETFDENAVVMIIWIILTYSIIQKCFTSHISIVI